ncbi:M23 family metallopeptidase [Candidatus Daviesbacteria bacterium]|nr:M23 family metallopeptidase [Candidatus Daviesbacteria bacterium]
MYKGQIGIVPPLPDMTKSQRYISPIPNGPGYWPLEEIDGEWKLCKALTPMNITQEPSIQFKWPTTGAIFSYFSKDHDGIDIAPPYGTPLYAAADGIVVDMQKLGWSYGWYEVIWHWRSNFLTLYGHMSQFDVQIGQPVKAGDLIGLVGSTGRSTGPHVHFSVYANVAGIGCVALNPLDYLP